MTILGPKKSKQQQQQQSSGGSSSGGSSGGGSGNNASGTSGPGPSGGNVPSAGASSSGSTTGLLGSPGIIGTASGSSGTSSGIISHGVINHPGVDGAMGTGHPGVNGSSSSGGPVGSPVVLASVGGISGPSGGIMGTSTGCGVGSSSSLSSGSSSHHLKRSLAAMSSGLGASGPSGVASSDLLSISAAADGHHHMSPSDGMSPTGTKRRRGGGDGGSSSAAQRYIPQAAYLQHKNPHQTRSTTGRKSGSSSPSGHMMQMSASTKGLGSRGASGTDNGSFGGVVGAASSPLRSLGPSTALPSVVTSSATVPSAVSTGEGLDEHQELLLSGAVPPGIILSSCPDPSGPQSSPHLSPSSPSSPTGYNSGDEYASCGAMASSTGSNNNSGSRTRGSTGGSSVGPSGSGGVVCTPDQMIEMEKRFEKKMRTKKGLMIEKMGEDGACLFRAVADQVYGDEEMHTLVRKLCCDYMMKNSDYFSQYVTEDFSAYVNRKRRDHIQGNHVELQALSELFARPIEVYHYSLEPINIYQSGQDEEEMMMMLNEVEPIRLSYHTPGMGLVSDGHSGCGHYNSVRNGRLAFQPKAPFVHYTPPHEYESAVESSEADALEKAMLEDKLRATDWEATSEALEEQVARESYLEWVRENERRKRGGPHAVMSPNSNPHLMTSSSSTVTNASNKSPDRLMSGNFSPKAGGSGHNSDNNQKDGASRGANSRRHSSYRLRGGHSDQDQEGDEGQMMTPDDFSIDTYQSYYDQFHGSTQDGPETEREILAQVLLKSRQEYLDSLKAAKQQEMTATQHGDPHHHHHPHVGHHPVHTGPSYGTRFRGKSPAPSTSSSSCASVSSKGKERNNNKLQKEKSPSPPLRHMNRQSVYVSSDSDNHLRSSHHHPFQHVPSSSGGGSVSGHHPEGGGSSSSSGSRHHHRASSPSSSSPSTPSPYHHNHHNHHNMNRYN